MRRVRALIGITGRKACAGGFKSDVKSWLNLGTAFETGARVTAEGWNLAVAVKCVENTGNTDGEGSPDDTDAHARKRGSEQD